MKGLNPHKYLFTVEQIDKEIEGWDDVIAQAKMARSAKTELRKLRALYAAVEDRQNGNSSNGNGQVTNSRGDVLGEFPCAVCDAVLTTQRGKTMHTTKMHGGKPHPRSKARAK